MSVSAGGISMLPTVPKSDVVIDLLDQPSLFPSLPGDVLVAILRWLLMADMLSIALVSSAWRELAIQTATLWWDLGVLGDIPPTQNVNRFLFLLRRSGNTSIRINISPNQLRAVSQALLDRLRAALDSNRHRIIALRFPRAHLYPCHNGCSLIGNASSLLHGLGPESTSLPLGNGPRSSWEITDIPSFNMHAIRRLAISNMQHQCAVSCLEVYDLEVESSQCDMRLVIQQYPNTRALTVRAHALGHDPSYVLEFRHLVELRIMYDATGCVYWDALAPFVMTPAIRRVMVDLSSSSRRFLQLVRHSLSELPASESWHIKLRSGATAWPQDSLVLIPYATRDIKAQLTVEIELGDGRERIFIFHKFGEALERMAHPLLHDQRTASVAVDGESALRLLYSAVGDGSLPHIKRLSVVTSDDESLVIPFRMVGLPRLKVLVLEQCTGRGSRLTTGRIEVWLAALKLDTKPILDLKNVFVYEESGRIKSANMPGARLYQRSWRRGVGSV